MGSSHTLDQLDICVDDTHTVANAGLLIDLGERPGAAHPGQKLLTLVQAMLAGGDCIDPPEPSGSSGLQRYI